MTENKEHKDITLIIPNKTTEITEKLINNLCKEKNIQIEDFKEVLIPDSVKSIGSWAFKNCTSLKSVNIPNSVTSIGSNVFRDCTSLKSITIPNSVTSIGFAAFSKCESLTPVTIPNSVTSIEDWAFRNCTNLKSITIPDSVICIKDKAFYNCTNLSYIKLECDVSAISDINVFDYCPDNMQIELKDGTVISIDELEDIMNNNLTIEQQHELNGKELDLNDKIEDEEDEFDDL